MLLLTLGLLLRLFMLEKEPENFMETVFYSLSTYSSGWQQVEKLRHSVFSTIFSGL